MTQDAIFREELVVTKELFYNEQSMYGAYGFRFKGAANYAIKVHPQWKNFSIAGQVPRLVEGETYVVNFKEGYDSKRGIDAYFFIKVESEGIKGRKANEQFIKALLTDKQAQAIITEFPFNEELVEDILAKRVDLTKVKGIGEATVESVIKKLSKVSEYSKAVVALAPLGASINAIERLVKHFNGVDTLLSQIEKNIYSLTVADGFGFKTVDEYALKTGMKLNDSRRIRAGALYVIETVVERGSTKIPIREFEESLCKILNIDEVDNSTFEDILDNKEIYYNNGYISLNKYLEEEISIIENFRRIRDNFKPKMSLKKAEEKLRAEEERIGVTFNEKQREAILSTTQKGLVIIDGKAGCGKSFSLKTALNITNPTYKAVALSGKAVGVLVENGLEASTIHRTLEIDMLNGGFCYNSENRLPHETIILDEASMVNNSLFLSIAEAVQTGSQLIIVGDSGQLPAIGRGATLTSLLNATEFAHTTLTEVHRQAADSGTLIAANDVREGKPFIDYNQKGLKVIGNNEDFYYIGYNDKTLIQQDIYNTVERYTSNPDTNNDDLQIITSLKERGDLSVKVLNNLLQPLFNPLSVIEEGREIKSSRYVFRRGDRIIQQGNNYKGIKVSQEYFDMLVNRFGDNADKRDFENFFKTGDGKVLESNVAIFNGTFGKIVDLHEKVGMLLQFEGVEGLVLYKMNTENNPVNMLELGYAITTHRSQGSGFKTVIIAMTFTEYMLLSRQLLYTALTRTIDTCFLYAETKAIMYAIKKNSDMRTVFMSDYLD